MGDEFTPARMTVLTSIDTVGLQSFVFGSQRLRDIVAASAAVSALLSEEGLRPHLGHAGTVHLAAGGNALVEHDDIDEARRFVARFTMNLAEQEPALGVSVVHVDAADQPTLRQLGSAQARRKLTRPPVAMQIGFGFTESCIESGRPAEDMADFDGRRRATAGDILRRRQRLLPAPPEEAVAEARRSLDDPEVAVDWAWLVDDLAVGAPKPEIAVVHLDGTGIGARIAGQVGLLSAAGIETLTLVSIELAEVFGSLSTEAVVRTAGHGARRAAGGTYVLPVRPVLQGGDDLTFVCRATLGVPLATKLLARLAATKPNMLEDDPIRAAAGVAIGPVGSPLWALVDHAHALTAKAKAGALAMQGWAYDWHVGLPGDDIDHLRSAHLGVDAPGHSSLTARPYVRGSQTADLLAALLSASAPAGNSPPGLGGIRSPWWRDHRTALRRLADLVRGGDGELAMAAACQHFERATGVDPAAHPGSAWRSLGWLAGRSVLLDAVELVDRWEDLP